MAKIMDSGLSAFNILAFNRPEKRLTDALSSSICADAIPENGDYYSKDDNHVREIESYNPIRTTVLRTKVRSLEIMNSLPPRKQGGTVPYALLAWTW